MKKKLILASIVLILILSLAACADTDIVGNDSVKSFEKILGAMEDSVSEDVVNGGWALTSPDGTARFFWSRDYSAGTMHDVILEFDAQPFLDAGLNPDKLPAGILAEGKIIVGSQLGDEELTYDGEPDPLASYKKLVELYRERVKYHADLDHYGVDVGGGNMFEWAKDMGTNDKDIVYVADPGIFIEAGVEPAKLEGWIFAKVKVMDESGRTIEADKFLKPFSIQ